MYIYIISKRAGRARDLFIFCGCMLQLRRVKYDIHNQKKEEKGKKVIGFFFGFFCA